MRLHFRLARVLWSARTIDSTQAYQVMQARVPTYQSRHLLFLDAETKNNLRRRRQTMRSRSLHTRPWKRGSRPREMVRVTYSVQPLTRLPHFLQSDLPCHQSVRLMYRYLLRPLSTPHSPTRMVHGQRATLTPNKFSAYKSFSSQSQSFKTLYTHCTEPT